MSHPDIDPLYYLDNFQYLIDWISTRYDDLLNIPERVFISQFRQLSGPAQALLVRLIMRKGKFFRLGKLSYPEIANDKPLAETVRELVSAGLVSCTPDLSLAELFVLFRRDELEKFLPVEKGVTKAQWMASLEGMYSKSQPFEEWAPDFDEHVIKLLDSSLYEYLRLIFFGNMRQDFSEFVLADLGLSTYESVDFDQHSRGFHEREDIEAYMRVYAVRLYLNEILEESKRSLLDRWPVEEEGASSARYSYDGHSVDRKVEMGSVALDSDEVISMPGLDVLDYLRATHASVDHWVIQRVLLTPITVEWIDQRRQRVLFKYAEAAAKYNACEYSLFLYAQCDAPGAKVKWLRLLERLHRKEEAYERVCVAMKLPLNQIEEQQLGRIYTRLVKRFGEPTREVKEPMNNSHDVSRRSLLVDAKRKTRSSEIDDISFKLQSRQHSSVEQAVATALSEPKGPVFYVENLLMNALFGLLFWKAIYAPIQGAFFHPFHNGPVDLFRPDFIEKRKPLFDEGFASLRDGRYTAIILDCFHQKQGVLSPFVFWAALSESLITEALTCIPAEHLFVWFQWMIQDLKHNRTGFPDLIQFWPDEQRYRMIEVKGPGDRLQDNQRRLIAYGREHDFPIEVCWVSWIEDEECTPPTLTAELTDCAENIAPASEEFGHHASTATIGAMEKGLPQKDKT
ncbi:hypothetical protein LMG33818_001629 [Halomonadaceae bacterium LMG 33818]|uniref:VRR-NUC domain-containing protein n=1 Tax=Cernens ardua TaxID=3402176 RepID=UPI003EDC3D2A